MKEEKYQDIPKNIIFKAIVGSQAYGTNIPGVSDEDHKGIFCQSTDELVSFKYVPQIEVTKDEVYFELRRFLELLSVANPTALELLYSPSSCILESHPAMQLLFENRERFLTKRCLNTFGAYVKAQITKATGLQKKVNWDKEKITRKTPLDFVYIHQDGKVFNIQPWLEERNMNVEQCGLISLNHFKDCYALYYDESGLLGYRGIASDNSNSMRLSCVPKGEKAIDTVFFNKEEYSKHCRDFREYEDWLKKRNVNRYVETKAHGQTIDAKNMLHCRRILDMCIEIAMEKKINVKRPNADFLLSIRRGELDLKDLAEKALEDVKNLDELYANSGLPDDVDKEFVNDLLIKMRRVING